MQSSGTPQVLGKNGRATPKRGGPDIPEIKSYSQYKDAARAKMGGGKPDGVLELIRPSGKAVVRFNPTTLAFGTRSADGVIRTFFRPTDPDGKVPAECGRRSTSRIREINERCGRDELPS